jgi:hypothetical protein
MVEATGREIAAVQVSAQRELEALVRNIDIEAMAIKRDIEELRNDMEMVRERVAMMAGTGSA